MGMFSGTGFSKYVSYTVWMQSSIIPFSSLARPSLPPATRSHKVIRKSLFTFNASPSPLWLVCMSIGFRYSLELVESLTTCPFSASTSAKYSPSGSQIIMSSFVERKQDKISRLAEKDLPLPGVPRITPFGVLRRFLSAMIMLLERAFRP